MLLSLARACVQRKVNSENQCQKFRYVTRYNRRGVNYKVNKYPSRKDLMQIADAVGRSFESVKTWFKKSRNIERRDGKLPSSHKCPDCHKVLSKYESLNRHKKSCQGQKDLVKEKLDAKTKDLNVEGTQEIISKELSDLRNQPPSGQNVDLFEMDFSDSDLRDVLDSDSD